MVLVWDMSGWQKVTAGEWHSRPGAEARWIRLTAAGREILATAAEALALQSPGGKFTARKLPDDPSAVQQSVWVTLPDARLRHDACGIAHYKSGAWHWTKMTPEARALFGCAMGQIPSETKEVQP
jgi:hypothetical protein